MITTTCGIGIIGWGTVGTGVVDLLSRERDLLKNRIGIELALRAIVTLTPERERGQAPGVPVSNDIRTITGRADIQVVALLVGGTLEAKALCLQCLRAGKHVVTANKALIAAHGDELFAEARAHQVGIAYESSVAGGIPIIGALRDGLVANRITVLCGILNGTCNYILTQMEQQGWGYQQALTEAQRLGYAEADPSLDVNGTDTAHKLAILARISFGVAIPLSAIRVEGITSITAADIVSAKTMGYRIKLLAVARSGADGVELHVAPTLIPLDHPLAAVSANYNGIYLVGSASGPQVYVGQGAGSMPTASAVVADLADVAVGRYALTATSFGFFQTGSAGRFLSESDEQTGSYARFVTPDRPGVLAGIATALSKHGISIRSLRQGDPAAAGTATIEITTHPAQGGAFLRAVSHIDEAGLTVSPTTCWRLLTV